MESRAIRHYLTLYPIAFLFLVFGIWEILNPQHWNVFVPNFILGIFSNANFLVQIHGAILGAIAVLFALNYKRKIVSIAATLIMFSIVISLYASSGFSDLMVRDIVITLFTASIYFDDYH